MTCGRKNGNNINQLILVLMNCSAGKDSQRGNCLGCEKEPVVTEKSSRREWEVNEECRFGWLNFVLTFISVLSALEK